MILRKDLRGGLVTDRPAVHIREKSFHRLYALIEIANHGDEEEMHKVLLKVPVRQFHKERFRLLRPPYLPGDPPHVRRIHAQHGLLGNVGNELALKVPILIIAAGSQPFIYLHYHPSFLKVRIPKDSSVQLFPAARADMRSKHPGC